MPDFFTLNSQEVNYTIAPSTLTQDAIVFDGYSLQNENILTSKIDYDDLGTIELNTFNFPRSNGGGILSKYRRGRKITLTATVKADTATEFNDLLDEIKQNLRTTEGYLDITVNSEIRRIKATARSIQFNRDHYNITFAKMVVAFDTVEPYFYAIDRQYDTYASKTGTFTEELTHQGTAEVDPVIYFIFGAGTSATAITFTDPDSRVLSISTSITVGDVIIIDAEQKTVTKNGTAIDYTGLFPIFSPGSNNFTIGFTGTVLVDVTPTIIKNYI